MKDLNLDNLDNLGNSTHAYELTLSKKIMIPAGLLSDLMSTASLNIDKGNYFSVHAIVNSWGIQNELYQRLMEFLFQADENEFSYFHTSKNRSNPIEVGNFNKFENTLFNAFKESE